VGRRLGRSGPVWLAAQLGPNGDALNAAVTIADQMLLALPFANDDGTARAGPVLRYTRHEAVGDHSAIADRHTVTGSPSSGVLSAIAHPARCAGSAR
jgi:hypothetical protein